MLEGLAASGLRAIRYAKEIEGVAKVRPVGHYSILRVAVLSFVCRRRWGWKEGSQGGCY